MDKKGNNGAVKKVIDDKEDLEIQKVAYLKTSSQKILLITLILIFFVMLGTTITFICNYYNNSGSFNNLGEVIEVKTNKNQALITNNGEIKENITKSSFDKKEDLVIEKVNTIQLKTNEKSAENGTIKFDVKYEILTNDFKRNVYASNDSEVLVRFSYSYDYDNWTYVNNVISTKESTISPLMGNYYDISGIKSLLNVVTNFEISSKPGENVKMYWRSETIIKNNQSAVANNNLVANYKLEYRENN